jgi:Fe-S cluster assembly protein SufD
MQCRNLLLSRDAEIDAKPQLEIYADDVKCAHGLTVGQLDPGAIFYLASRGVDEVEARQLLTYGFANEIVERIRPHPLKERIQNELGQRLSQATIGSSEG